MCELNSWHNLESTSVNHLDKNFPRFRTYAASVGFVHSHVMHSTDHPYNIGIMSALPFNVLHEYQPPLFERGVLHVLFRTINVHVFVAHLNAHNAHKREIETAFIASKVIPLIRKGEKVIVMGDLNSLSPQDKALHKEEDLDHFLNDHGQSPNLRLKLLNASGNINYQPIQNLLDSGLTDTCAISCEQHGEDVEACMSRNCRASEPTLFNPEVILRLFMTRYVLNLNFPQIIIAFVQWSESTPQPDIRLDFILASPALLGTRDDVHDDVGKNAAATVNKEITRVINAGVEVNNKTAYLSDHFPVFFQWWEPIC